VPTSSSRNWSPDELKNLNGLKTPKEKKRCKACKDNFVYQAALVYDSTFFHAFAVHKSTVNITEYPLTLQFPTMGSNDKIVTFNLGYFSMSSKNSNPRGMTHHVSIHYIPTLGFKFYDGMKNNGDLFALPYNYEKIYVFSAAVYFRKP
jgi:hypothetical protein